ncbi:MAG: polymer-forming cytoskeletal protein [Spirochaetaceae bacterium]|jgi:cytoskeletal protein CcmA (bactofilin family)|nr:polymer-forming cytoskeletal protein [Spirochaetaceae bacterium]
MKFETNADEKKKEQNIVTLAPTTELNGFLRFKDSLCIRGKFRGTIEAEGSLIVDKGANVEADHISVSAITVYGKVAASVKAEDKVDLFTGAEVHGDITAGRLRIADGVIFEGTCNMIDNDKEIEIFARPNEEIKAELTRRRV